MAQNQEILRSNISLTGDGSKLIRKVQAKLQVKHDPVNVSLADVVIVALTLLDNELDDELEANQL